MERGVLISLQEKQALIRALFERTLPMLVFASDEACSKLLASLQPFVSELVREDQLQQRKFQSMNVAELLSLAGNASTIVGHKERKKPTERVGKAKEKRKDEPATSVVNSEGQKEKNARKDYKPSAPPRKRDRSPSLESSKDGRGDMWDFEKVCLVLRLCCLPS
jgi:hypothetical protein